MNRALLPPLSIGLLLIMFLSSCVTKPDFDVAFGNFESPVRREKIASMPNATLSAPQTTTVDAPFYEGGPTGSAKPKLTIYKDRPPVIFPVHRTGACVAFADEVGIPKLEVVEVDEEKIRIFVRVQNVVERDVKVMVNLTPNDKIIYPFETYSYEDIILVEDVYRDFSFLIYGPKDRRFTVTVDTMEKYRKRGL